MLFSWFWFCFVSDGTIMVQASLMIMPFIHIINELSLFGEFRSQIKKTLTEDKAKEGQGKKRSELPSCFHGRNTAKVIRVLNYSGLQRVEEHCNCFRQTMIRQQRELKRFLIELHLPRNVIFNFQPLGDFTRIK